MVVVPPLAERQQGSCFARYRRSQICAIPTCAWQSSRTRSNGGQQRFGGRYPTGIGPSAQREQNCARTAIGTQCQRLIHTWNLSLRSSGTNRANSAASLCRTCPVNIQPMCDQNTPILRRVWIALSICALVMHPMNADPRSGRLPAPGYRKR